MFCSPSCFAPSSLSTKEMFNIAYKQCCFVTPAYLFWDFHPRSGPFHSVTSPDNTFHLSIEDKGNRIYNNLNSSFPLGLFLSGSLSSQSVLPFRIGILTEFAACCKVQHSHLKKNWTLFKILLLSWLLKDVTLAKLGSRLSSAASNRNRASCQKSQKCQHRINIALK